MDDPEEFGPCEADVFVIGSALKEKLFGAVLIDIEVPPEGE